MRIIFGLIGVIAGAFIVIKSTWFYTNFGAVPWAEQYLGSGGSHTFYKLLGVAIVIVSFLIITGMIENVLMAIFGPLFGIRQ